MGRCGAQRFVQGLYMLVDSNLCTRATAIPSLSQCFAGLYAHAQPQSPWIFGIITVCLDDFLAEITAHLIVFMLAKIAWFPS